MAAQEIVIVRLCSEIVEGLMQLDDVRKPEAWKLTQDQFRSQAAMVHVVHRNAMLAGVSDFNAVSGVRIRLQHILRYLLHELAADQEIDGAKACKALEHIYNPEALGWSPRSLRLADDLGIELPPTAREVRLDVDLWKPR